MSRVVIVAEAGVNHNQQIALARELIDRAHDAGADVVKFQTAVPELVMTEDARMADYQLRNLGQSFSQLEMAKRLHLPLESFVELQEHAGRLGIEFLSTPFDMVSFRFLHSIGIPRWKIASGEITNYPLLKQVGALRQPVMLSTGMCNLGEIEDALTVLTAAGVSKDDITLLHCHTDYPTKFEDVNLRAMLTLRAAFMTHVGYSDHTRGMAVALAAVALGATVIEKHFTIDRSLPGPDHKASLEPAEFAAMVTSIREIELALGDGIKCASPSESPNIPIVRKSIVAARMIRKHETFSDDNLTTKRPGDGISPMRWMEVIGRKADRDYEKDEQIRL